jgi:hypothetical protein
VAEAKEVMEMAKCKCGGELVAKNIGLSDTKIEIKCKGCGKIYDAEKLIEAYETLGDTHIDDIKKMCDGNVSHANNVFNYILGIYKEA